MKRNYIFRKAGILLIVAIMILSTVAVTAHTNEAWKISNNIKNKNLIPRDDILFESWDAGIPGDWTQELVALNYYWDKYYGGWDWGTGPIPAAPHTDPWNVMFEPTVGPEGAITKLITPSLDLSTVTNPKVEFWYAIPEDPSVQPTHTGQEIITIYYKTSAAGSWIPVPGGHYDQDTPQWTEDTLDLPDPSGDYYIAFEGEYHWGYGACLDDIRVYSEGGGDPLVADADGPYEADEGEPIQFQGSASGGVPPYSFHWDFGNGDTADEEDPIYTYDDPGVYQVILTVTDDVQTTDDDETTATINEKPCCFEVEILPGFGIGLRAEVTEICNESHTGVPWEFKTTGGLIIIPISPLTGTADFTAGETKKIKAPLFLGIGSIQITFTIDDCDPREVNALIIGPFVIVR